MISRRNALHVVLLVTIVASLLAVPMVAGAQSANGITAPKDGATVSGTVDITGTANDPQFMKWQLDLLPNGNQNAPIFLAVGETPGAVKYALNTAPLPNGDHALRLRVVRKNSNYDEFITKFKIANGAAAAAAAAATTPKPAAPVTTTVKAATAVTTTTAVKATTPVTPTVKATTPVTTTAKPAAAPAPTANGISAPKDGATVNGAVEVMGMATDPRFMKWQLDLLPGGNANAPIFLAVGNTPGVLTHTLNTAPLPNGQHALRLRVVRNDSNYNEYTNKFTIANGAAPAAAAAPKPATPVTTTVKAATPVTTTAAVKATTPVTPTIKATAPVTTTAKPAAAPVAAGNGISAPKDGATVSGTVDVTGEANDAHFMKWQLDLLPGGNANAPIFLAVGETPGAVKYALNTLPLPNGEHALRLRVVRNNSNYDEYVTKFKIANGAAAAAPATKP